MKKEDLDKKREEKVIPKYEFIVDEESEAVAPVKRKIAKTMETVEEFCYFDALKYCMQMEKALVDKEGEIEGLKNMIKAYRDELDIIEKQFDLNNLEKEFQLTVQEEAKCEGGDPECDDVCEKDCIPCDCETCGPVK